MESADAPGHVKLAIVSLKMRLASTAQNMRVDMGRELFRECRRRGLISMEEFTPHGPGFRPQLLPAYGRNIVLIDPELPDWEFRIGDEDA